MKQDYYQLWHLRFDQEDRDYDKFLGIYSTLDKAERGLALLHDKPGFCDYPDNFEINEGPINKTHMTDGFITMVGDQELEEPQNVYTSITERAPKDIPVWALGEKPGADENGGEFVWRLMDRHYGAGKWSRDNDEFDQLRKFGNRGHLDPRSNRSLHDDDPPPQQNGQPIYYALWHRRTDEYDRDHDMLLGIYSTREKAEEGRALLRDQLGFRDYPYSFEITWGRFDETYEAEGFVTVPADRLP